MGHEGGTSQPGGPETVFLAQAHRRRGLDPAPGQRWEDGAGVQPLPGLGLPANGVSNIARAQAGPGTAEEPGANQEVDARPMWMKAPTWPGWACRVRGAAVTSVS